MAMETRESFHTHEKVRSSSERLSTFEASQRPPLEKDLTPSPKIHFITEEREQEFRNRKLWLDSRGTAYIDALRVAYARRPYFMWGTTIGYAVTLANIILDPSILMLFLEYKLFFTSISAGLIGTGVLYAMNVYNSMMETGVDNCTRNSKRIGNTLKKVEDRRSQNQR